MNRKRFELSIGVVVHISDWDEKAQIFSGRSEKVRIINNRLDKFVSKISDVYNQFESTGVEFDISHLKKKLTGGNPEMESGKFLTKSFLLLSQS